MASGLASTAGFDVDELDDLRIAVDEAVSALLEGGDGAPPAAALRGRRRRGGDDRADAGGSGDALDEDRLELSTQILAAVCDEHELAVADGTVRVRICRRRGDGAGT